MDPPRISRKLFLVILIFLHPWILAIIPFSFAAGYLSIVHFDLYSEQLTRIIKIIKKLSGYPVIVLSTNNETLADLAAPTDPLQSQLLLRGETPLWDRCVTPSVCLLTRVSQKPKSYEEWDHRDVNKRVKVDETKCDILESVSDTCKSYNFHKYLYVLCSKNPAWSSK